MSWKSAGQILLLLSLIAGSFQDPASAAQGIPKNYPKQSNYLTQRQNQISMIASGRPGWTTNQRLRGVLPAGMAPLSYVSQGSGAGTRNGLPPTRFDSFVRNAGAHAEHIYGDENIVYECFTEAHRINTGINGDRDSGLTTGHGSYMPDAWGRDEFSGSPEFSQSGERGFELNEQAIRSAYSRKYGARNDYDDYKLKHQFYNGSKVLDKANFYDEDRARGVDDPYNPYLASQDTAQQMADKQVADAMKRYNAMNHYK